MIRLLATGLAALLLAAPLAASGQEVPSYAQAPQGASGDEQIRGRVTDFDGGYNLTVRDERGYIDNVNLHPGTIINPTGLTLAPGMIVSILGYNQGADFSANEIDTPYSYDAGVPYYSGHPWNYYGPSISLGFFFGNVGWWHGDRFRGGYSFVSGARYYNNVHIRNDVNIRNVYRGGGAGFEGRNAYRGRDAVAPRYENGYRGGSARVQSFGESRSAGQQRFATPRFQGGGNVRAQSLSQQGTRGGGHAGGYAGGGHGGGVGHGGGGGGGHAHGGGHH